MIGLGFLQDAKNKSTDICGFAAELKLSLLALQ